MTNISETKPHPPPKKTLPMYQLASPMTEWGAPEDGKVEWSTTLRTKYSSSDLAMEEEEVHR